ncbi:MAG: hydrolase [bacterium]
MQVNHVPKLSTDNPTGCCPRFNPQEWDGQTFVFKDKSFVRFTVRSFFYIPLNMNSVMTKTLKQLTAAQALGKDEHIMLSYDISPWQAEHYLAVTKKVEGMTNVKLSGAFLAKVFEGPFQNAPKWIKAMNTTNKVYLNYTMCPKCSKFYGHNYVVALAKL